MTTVLYYEAATGKATEILTGPSLEMFPPGDATKGALILDNPVCLPGYVQAGQFYPLPPQPSAFHVFNWATKQWEDPRTLQDLKDERWKVIKAARVSTEVGTFVWQGHTVDADKERINGAATGVLIAKGLGQNYSDVWTLADNTTIPVTGDDILSMGVSLIQHVSACHAHARALRQQLEDATTPEAVAAVVWNL